MTRPLRVEETQQAEDHRDGEQAGLGRRLAPRHLHVLAEEDRRAEQRDADGDARDDGEHERAVAEQVQRQDRLGGAGLDPDREGEQDQREPTSMAAVCQEAQANWWPAKVTHSSSVEMPAEISSAPGVVDAHRALRERRQLEGPLQDDHGGHGERDADEEVPAPAGAVGEDAAQERAADHADAHDGPHEAHVPAPLARGDDVGDQDGAERGEAAGAETLERAHRDEHLGGLREARPRGRRPPR